MFCKRNYILFLFFPFLVSNSVAQLNVPDTPYCEKSFDFLKSNCYECDNYSLNKKCKVEKFDYLGKANNKFYYYGVYVIEPFKPDNKFYHFAIYEGDSNKTKLKPIHFFYPRFGYYYYNIEMVKTKFGYIIHIMLQDKIPAKDDGEYIILRNGKWEKIREPNWFCAAKNLLPEGYNLDFYSAESWVKIDLKNMSIKIPVEYDYHPTGGFVYFKLAVEKDRFGIVSSNYIPGKIPKKKYSKTDAVTYTISKKSIDYLKRNCYPYRDNLTNFDCIIREFKYLGDDNGKQYYYGLYILGTDNYPNDSSYFVIYEGKKGDKNLIPVHFLFTDFDYSYSVEMVNTKYGLIIHIFLLSGNGGWDSGEYIIRRNGKWKKLNIPDWNCVYEWIIPEDTHFCRGNYIDLKEMTNTFSVYSYDDGCCCPTRGIVTSKLTIDDNGFRVISSKYYPDLSK